jgi:hypothetical protein
MMASPPAAPPFTVELDLPPDFHRLPPPDAAGGADGTDGTDPINAFVRALFPAADADRGRALIDHYTRIAATAAITRAGLVAVCMGRRMDRGGERVTSAVLTVGMAPREGDALVAIEGITAIGRERGPSTVEIVRTNVPAGPAVATIRTRTLRLPAADSPTGEEIRLDIGYVQAFLAVVGHPVLVVLTLMTPTPEDLVDYARLTGTCLSSVRVEPRQEEP